MQWYIDRLDELKKAKPLYSVCGDDRMFALLKRAFYEKEINLHLEK